MTRRTFVRSAAVAVALASVLGLATIALAHQTIVVGEGDEQYRVSVGMVREPVVTDERNGLDLIVRAMDDEPVSGLETSLSVVIIAPGGQERPLVIRAQWGRPGSYTDDVVLTATGVYRIHVTGFIGSLEVDETFETHEVRPLSDLAFP